MGNFLKLFFVFLLMTGKPVFAAEWSSNSYDFVYIECIGVAEVDGTDISASEWQAEFDRCMASRGYPVNADYILSRALEEEKYYYGY